MLKLPHDAQKRDRLLKALSRLSNDTDFTVLSEFLSDELKDMDTQLRTAESEFLRVQGRAQVLARILDLQKDAKSLLLKIANQA